MLVLADKLGFIRLDDGSQFMEIHLNTYVYTSEAVPYNLNTERRLF